MTTFTRIAVAAYLIVLTVGLMAGQWFLQGPVLLGAGGHGLHAGDVVVSVATMVAAIALVNPTLQRPAATDTRRDA